jgi:hypothetical protein
MFRGTVNTRETNGTKKTAWNSMEQVEQMEQQKKSPEIQAFSFGLPDFPDFRTPPK